MPKVTTSKFVNRPRSGRKWQSPYSKEEIIELSMSEGHRMGKLFCDLRIMRGMKQDELANLIGVDKSVISNFETGRRPPQFRLMLRMFVALGANLSITLYKPNEHGQPKRQPRNESRVESRNSGN